MTTETTPNDFVCDDCGIEFIGTTPEAATWHNGKCSICLNDKPVTQARDFVGPNGLKELEEI